MIRMTQENALAVQVPQSCRSIPSGRPIGGKPLLTDPTTATPWVDASVAADAMLSSTTATIAPGIFGANRLKVTMMTRVAAAYAEVVALASPSDVSRCHC